jgi:hypothetical protein
MEQTASTTGAKVGDIMALGFGQPNQYQKSFGGGHGIFLGRPTLSMVRLSLCYLALQFANITWKVRLNSMGQ